jgi:hypothetical protein
VGGHADDRNHAEARWSAATVPKAWIGRLFFAALVSVVITFIIFTIANRPSSFLSDRPVPAHRAGLVSPAGCSTSPRSVSTPRVTGIAMLIAGDILSTSTCPVRQPARAARSKPVLEILAGIPASS